tara:strand:+ start:61 stop:1263 length:1203 start_codon:yes stop_codon:yes gene_type:complete
LRQNRIDRLEKLLGLLDDLQSPNDSVKKELHQKYFNDIKVRTLRSDFEKLFELKIIKKYKTRTPWSKKEDQILTTYSKVMTLEELRSVYLPHRKYSMVNHRSSKLKLNLHQYKTSPWSKHWTKTETYILVKSGELGLSTPEISEKLPDRTELSISLRLWKLGYSTREHKTEDYKNRPWDKWEERILRKWYPIVGQRRSKRKDITGTPNIRDFLPNRTSNSIKLKSHDMRLKYEPQKDLKTDQRRCVLCLHIKNINEFSGIRKKSQYCKDCDSNINYVRKHVMDDFEIHYLLGINLQKGYRRTFEDYIPRINCVKSIQRVIKKHGYKCFFEDDYCDNQNVKNLTIDHILPSSIMKDKNQYIDPNNLLIMCKNHNVFKSDLTLIDLKSTIQNMSKRIEEYYN